MHRRDAIRAGAGSLGVGLLGRVADGGAADYAPLGTLELDGATELVVDETGRTAYVATGDGYAVVDLVEPADPTLLAERRNLLADREGGPLSVVQDVKVDGDTLLVVGPAHRRPGRLAGCLVVDVSDPANPRRRAFHETPYPIHNADLNGDHAYLTANGDPVRLAIVDVRTGETVGEWALVARDERWAEVARTLRTLHDVVVRDGVAYLAHWDAGTWLLDVSDPTDPRYLGHVAEQSRADLAAIPDGRASHEAIVPPGNSHYAAPNADGSLLAVGRESWAHRPAEGEPPVGGPSGVDLYDATDPTDLRHLARIPPEHVPDETFDGTWTTPHNFGFDGDVLYTSWYQAGVKRFDVSDPAEPALVTWWRDPDRARFWTARPAVAGEFFVASSMGTRAGGPPGVFTFPDRAGTGGEALPAATTGTSTATPTPTETPTATPTPTPTQSPTPTHGTTGSPSTATSTGLGLLAGALGTLAGAAWIGRRADREDS